jgi:hypothetical protein
MFSPADADRSTMKNDRDKAEAQTAAPVKQGPAKNPPQDPRQDSRQDPRPDPRQDRLKQALRENLKRRKSQARGRREDMTASSNRDDASPHDGSGKKPDP